MLVKLKCVLVCLLFAGPVVANGKVEEIVLALGHVDDMSVAVEQFKPASHLRDESVAYNELDALVLRQTQENQALFEQYFSKQSLLPEVIKTFESAFTPKEIDAAYAFMQTRHGAAFLRRLGDLDQHYGGMLSGIAQGYVNGQKTLAARHDKEFFELEKSLAAVNQDELAGANKSAGVTESKGVSLTDLVRFSVVTENGEMIGYRISEGREVELFHKTALKAGDILISLNGVTLDDPKKIRELVNLLKTQKQLHCEVRRKREFINVVIDLEELDALHPKT